MSEIHPFFDFFEKKRPSIPRDSKEWNDAWIKINYKSYPRFPRVQLPKTNIKFISLEESIQKRKSQRNFSSESLDLNELSSLLFWGAGITAPGPTEDEHRRAYPSGGGRYPIEIYFAALNVENLEKGIYHYNVLEHSAEFMQKTSKEKIQALSFYEFTSFASAVFFFTLIPSRSTNKYGNFGYKIGLIEAGHIAQNMYLISSALDLKSTSIGAFKDIQATCELLDVDGQNEVPFYSFIVGK